MIAVTQLMSKVVVTALLILMPLVAWGQNENTAEDRSTFPAIISSCWVIDPASEASQVSVTVTFELDLSGRITGDVKLINNSEGSQDAVRQAFEAARRAILRCQTDGYAIPASQHQHPPQIVLTFNPDQAVIFNSEAEGTFHNSQMVSIPSQTTLNQDSLLCSADYLFGLSRIDRYAIYEGRIRRPKQLDGTFVARVYERVTEAHYSIGNLPISHEIKLHDPHEFLTMDSGFCVNFSDPEWDNLHIQCWLYGDEISNYSSASGPADISIRSTPFSSALLDSVEQTLGRPVERTIVFAYTNHYPRLSDTLRSSQTNELIYAHGTCSNF